MMIKVKKISSALFAFFILMSAFPYEVFAEGYTSEGLLTTMIKVGEDDPTCSTLSEEQQKELEEGKNKWSEGFNKDSQLPKENKDDNENKFIQIMVGPLYRFMGDFFGGDGDSKGVVDGGCTEEFSISRHIMKITAPVKITDYPELMSYIKQIQNISLGCMIAFIVFYGFQYTVSAKDLENPMQFAYRMGAVIFAISFAPRIIQDVLNLNNIFVYYISSIPIPQATFVDNAALGGAALGLTGAMAAGQILSVFVGSILTGGAIGLGVLVAILILLIMILIPLIRICVWWYLRLLTIILMSVFSPIFFMMFASAKTSNMAKRYFITLAAEIFSQTFVTIGFHLFVVLLSSFATMSTRFDLGMIGLAILLYAIAKLLAELPEITKRWIGGSQTLGYREVSSAIAGGVGAAIGASFDRSMKKYNGFKAKKQFEKGNNEQLAKVSSAMANSNSFSALNDPNMENNNTPSRLEKIKNDIVQQPNQQGSANGMIKKRQANTGQYTNQVPVRKNVSQLMGASGGGQVVTQPNPNQEALKQSMNDNIAFGLQSQEIEHYSDGVKQKLLDGAKNGTLNLNQATSLLKDDLMTRGENSLAAATQAGRDLNKLQNTYGIKFGEKNDNVVTGASPIEGLTNSHSQQPQGIFSDETMSKIQDGLQSGMHRADAVKEMQKDLETNRKMNPEMAANFAEARMQAFEKNSPTGLGFEAQSQINKLAKSGDLTQNHVRDIARRDAVYAKGMTKKDDIQKHIDNVMSKGGFESSVGQKSNRDSAVVKKAPSLNLGNNVRTQGGIGEGVKATSGKRQGVDYQIPNQEERTNSLQEMAEKMATNEPTTQKQTPQEVQRKATMDGDDSSNPKDSRNVIDDTVIGSSSHIAENREFDIEKYKEEGGYSSEEFYPDYADSGEEIITEQDTSYIRTNTYVEQEDDLAPEFGQYTEQYYEQELDPYVAQPYNSPRQHEHEDNTDEVRNVYDKYSHALGENNVQENQRPLADEPIIHASTPNVDTNSKEYDLNDFVDDKKPPAFVRRDDKTKTPTEPTKPMNEKTKKEFPKENKIEKPNKNKPNTPPDVKPENKTNNENKKPK